MRGFLDLVQSANQELSLLQIQIEKTFQVLATDFAPVIFAVKFFESLILGPKIVTVTLAFLSIHLTKSLLVLSKNFFKL